MPEPRQGDLQGSLLSLEVRQRPELEDPILVGSLELKGAIPVKRDLHAGQQLTVQIAGPDGEIVATGIYEVGLPGFKDVKMRGVGVVGTERVHKAKYDADG